MTMIRPRSDVVYGIYRGLPSDSAQCDNVDYITLVHVLTNTVIVSIFDFRNRDMLKTFYDYDIR